MMRAMRCHECDHGFWCCHATSIEHADGTTECLGDEPCELAHWLHPWAVACTEVDPACACVGADEVELPLAA
jgi:hypothetical protein